MGQTFRKHNDDRNAFLVNDLSYLSTKSNLNSITVTMSGYENDVPNVYRPKQMTFCWAMSALIQRDNDTRLCTVQGRR